MSREPETGQPAPVQPPAPQPAARPPRDPLHGMTLEAILTALQAYYGWRRLSEQIPIRCFGLDPSIPSSLKFLRKTPWARAKVDQLYLYMLRQQRRESSR